MFDFKLISRFGEMDNKIAFLLSELSVSMPNDTATKGKQNSHRLKTQGNACKASSVF